MVNLVVWLGFLLTTTATPTVLGGGIVSPLLQPSTSAPRWRGSLPLYSTFWDKKSVSLKVPPAPFIPSPNQRRVIAVQASLPPSDPFPEDLDGEDGDGGEYLDPSKTSDKTQEQGNIIPIGNFNFGKAERVDPSGNYSSLITPKKVRAFRNRLVKKYDVYLPGGFLRDLERYPRIASFLAFGMFTNAVLMTLLDPSVSPFGFKADPLLLPVFLQQDQQIGEFVDRYAKLLDGTFVRSYMSFMEELSVNLTIPLTAGVVDPTADLPTISKSSPFYAAMKSLDICDVLYSLLDTYVTLLQRSIHLAGRGIRGSTRVTLMRMVNLFKTNLDELHVRLHMSGMNVTVTNPIFVQSLTHFDPNLRPSLCQVFDGMAKRSVMEACRRIFFGQVDNGYRPFDTFWAMTEFDMGRANQFELFAHLRAVDFMCRSAVFSVLPGQLGEAFLLHPKPKDQFITLTEDYLLGLPNRHWGEFVVHMRQELSDWALENKMNLELDKTLPRCLMAAYHDATDKMMADFWRKHDKAATASSEDWPFLSDGLVKEFIQVLEVSKQDIRDLGSLFEIQPFSLPREEALHEFCMRKSRYLYLMTYQFYSRHKKDPAS